MRADLIPRIPLDPGSALPAAGEDMHFGEHNPYSLLGWVPVDGQDVVPSAERLMGGL